MPTLSAAQLLAKSGDFPGALRAANAVDPEDLRLRLLVEIASAQESAGDGGGATATLHKALRLACFGGDAEQIARIQAKMGDMAAALKTVSLLKVGEGRQ